MNNNENNTTQAVAENITPEKKKSSFLSELFDYFELFILSACCVLIVFSFVTRICRVSGDSMLNTLYNSETLIVSDILYNPERGDIIVFHQTGDQPGDLNEPVVKRVIATEGEWIDIEVNNNRLTVTIYDSNKENPQVLDEDYANYLMGTGYYRYTNYPIQVPEGCIFVMGDNRGNSLDSRSDSIGFVDVRRVLGKVVCRVLPFDKFGTVN